MSPDATLTDPVCGMTVRPDGPHRLEHDGTTYGFCSAGCLAKFRADADRYLDPSPAPESATPARAYTCPMHPEIVRAAPGSCPICGMALEPMSGLPDEDNPELEDMTRRFWVSLVLAVPVFGVAMAEMLPGAPLAAVGLTPTTLTWIQLLLGTPVVLWGGWPFFVRGWASLQNRHLNMFTLIALGTGAAWGYSMLAAIAPGIFPASFRGHHGQVAVYFEAAAVIVTLVLLGQVLELRARSQTGAAIR